MDHAFQAVGNATLVRQAIKSLAIRGPAPIVGVLPPDAMIEFPSMAIRPACRVQTSGWALARREGHAPGLNDINEAFRAMKTGEVARTVLTFDCPIGREPPLGAAGDLVAP